MIQTENWEGVEVYKIENNQVALWIAPALGANLFRIKDKKKGLDILRTPRSPELLNTEHVFWGTPVLFPPNRIKSGSFQFQGQTYRLPVNTIEGNHIHGLVLDKEWRFDTLSDIDDVLSFTCSLDFIDHSEILEAFPNHLKLSMTVVLDDRTIVQTMQVVNKGNGDAPIGYGLHSWFNLAGGMKRWKLTLPFESIWELGDDVMPTGRLLPPGRLAPLRTGISLADESFDTALFVGNLSHTARLVRDDGYTIEYSSDDSFPHWIVHTSPRIPDTIALEPYTWITNAPNIRDISAQTGFISIAPGKEVEFKTSLVVGA